MGKWQANSNFWGTGVELCELRETMDPVEARMFLANLSMRVFGYKFDYSLVEFRGLNVPVKFIIKETGEVFETTPFRHLMTWDGLGYD